MRVAPGGGAKVTQTPAVLILTPDGTLSNPRTGRPTRAVRGRRWM